MQYKIPLFALVIITSLFIFFLRKRRLPVTSSTVFSFFMITAIFNICAEIFTLWTIYHIDSAKDAYVIPSWINRLSHQLFIGSLDVFICLLYTYIDCRAHVMVLRKKREFVLKFLPLFLSLLAVCFAPLNYVSSPEGIRYSSGPMAYTVYISVAIYIVLSIVSLIRFKDKFPDKTWKIILIGIFLWFIIPVIQFFYPYLLLSSVGVTLITLFLFISFENPGKYTEMEMSEVMNSHAFWPVFSEYIKHKKKFSLITFTISNEQLQSSYLSHEDITRMMKSLCEKQSKITHCIPFRIKENTAAIFTQDLRVIDTLIDKRMEVLNFKNSNGINFPIEYFISIIDIPSCASSDEQLRPILDYISTDGVKLQTRGLLIIDKSTVENMEYIANVEMLVKNAIQNDGFDVYYQPIFSTQKKAFVSAEALVRLKDTKTLGFISPEVFIPIAEKHGMILELGRIVFEKVCNFANKNNLMQKGIEYIEVNLSSIQCVDRSLPEMLFEIMERHNIPYSFINLEITETASVQSGEILKVNMEKLHSAGCTFSMDDFGTGYSNLSKMVGKDFDLIKLDKSLLWPCFDKDNKDSLILIETCIALVQQLGLHIVAEGVETEEMVNFLKERNVSYLQGFFYSKPIPEEKYLEFLENHKAA